ncbi:MAG: NAD(P)/FAD-dependent oxidoreductase [Pirellulales bacterium]|nr:NAD(P)/FAD-dependent oxidoreductase [Pirellulales bacterium]
MAHFDAIIIGAGMSGLAAGIRAAYYEKKVCILERHYTIGGLNSFYRLRKRDYDVGLHAVTNYTPKGTKHGPLARLLRQLRFRWDEFDLAQQNYSAVQFPDKQLRFSNDLELLRSEVAREYPDQIDNFERLLTELIDYDDLAPEHFDIDTREWLSEIISDPQLVEMILCPVMWYGNAREHDMDLGQFCIMFRSLFLEGFARPFEGVRLILRKLVKKFRELGGELKLRHGVSQIEVENGTATGVVLDDGTQITADAILSSAGAVETMHLCGQEDSTVTKTVGQMSFIESVASLDCEPKDLGHDATIIFFNDSDTFHWERPHDSLCDLRTGVICTPNNYQYDPSHGPLPDGVMRITAIADYDQWNSLSESEYQSAKTEWQQRAIDSAIRFVPDYQPQIIDTDMFTPTTIRKFTWHDNGAVYGATKKWFSGQSNVKNLYLCGTDQGYVGIIGSIVSGIMIANQYVLQ